MNTSRIHCTRTSAGAAAMLFPAALALGIIIGADGALANSGVSGTGAPATSYPGNFVSSDDDQVCYDMSALGYIGEVTEEMRGFKIDPPGPYNDGYVGVTLSPDGRYLDWTSLNNATVLAFIVKGGPNYNLYDYVTYPRTEDTALHSPLTKGKVPQISHYNVCYTVPVEVHQGCGSGYWRNHADRWTGVAPSDDFDATFGVDLFNPNVTLGWAIWATGGGNNAFARHATAALLNAYGGVPNADGTTVNYPYTAAEVIQMVQDAVANSAIDATIIDATKDEFETANQLGCPLSGTSAVPVVP